MIDIGVQIRYLGASLEVGCRKTMGSRRVGIDGQQKAYRKIRLKLRWSGEMFNGVYS